MKHSASTHPCLPRGHEVLEILFFLITHANVFDMFSRSFGTFSLAFLWPSLVPDLLSIRVFFFNSATPSALPDCSRRSLSWTIGVVSFQQALSEAQADDS